MTIKTFAGSAALLAGIFSFGSTALAGPAVTTNWQETTLSFQECLQRGESAMRSAGFGRFERTGQSVFAQRGDYTASVRCLEDKEIAFFVVAGPAQSDTKRYMDTIYNKF
jgi:hypothetical protein